MKDISANILTSLIDFMYHGSAEIPQDNINDFLKTAQSLDIKGLAEKNSATDEQVTNLFKLLKRKWPIFRSWP